jgi:ribosomal protein S18
MGNSRAAVAVATIALAVGAAGCGGSDEPERLTSAEFRQQANAVCSRVNAQLARIAYPTDVAAFRAWVAERNSVQERGIAQLEAITPPTATNVSFDSLQAALANANRSIQESAERLMARDRAGMQAASDRAAEQQRKVVAVATKLGLRDCATLQ